MQDGLYKVTFQTPAGQGNGVVFLQGGKFVGGDSIMYYAGTYVVNAGNFSAEVKTNSHSQEPGMQSVFGRDQVSISLNGTVSGDSVTVNGTAVEVPGVAFQATLTRLPI